MYDSTQIKVIGKASNGGSTATETEIEIEQNTQQTNEQWTVCLECGARASERERKQSPHARWIVLFVIIIVVCIVCMLHALCDWLHVRHVCVRPRATAQCVTMGLKHSRCVYA